MTNEQIIFNAAISSGIFTKEEAIAILESGRRLPLHTYQEWRRLGYQVKQNEHAYLAKSHLSPLRRSRKPPPSRSKHAKSSWPITACLPSSARPVQPLNS